MIGKLSMQTVCRPTVGSMGLFDCIKTAKINYSTFICNLGSIWFSGSRYSYPLRKEIGSFFINKAIGSILPISSLTQILNPVVEPITVNMVNLTFWPSSIKHKPRETMGFVNTSTGCYASIAFIVNVTSHISRLDPACILRGLYPNNDAGFRIILKKFMQLAHRMMLGALVLNVNWNKT